MKKRSHISTYLGAFVLLVHISGMIGVQTSFAPLFIKMTALNLMLSFGLMVYFHELKHKLFWIYTSAIVGLGFLIELIGVNTGFPFGEYSYGFPFGPQILGTPPVIGLNWFVLTYGVAYLMRNLKVGDVTKALIVGVLVTALDVMIEPVAIHLDYWTWEAVQVPIQNYVTWFVCVAIFSFGIYKMEASSKEWKNPLVGWIIGSTVLYFLGVWMMG